MSESEYKVGNLYKITRSLIVWNTPPQGAATSDMVCGGVMVGDMPRRGELLTLSHALNIWKYPDYYDSDVIIDRIQQSEIVMAIIHMNMGDGPRLLVLTPRAVVGWCYFNDEEQLRTWVS